MNNNNNRNNNRRRGRGNRGPGGGGGHQQNRIDSRARGNAPQLLDKYKKLAQDAAHNGDRVQAEYFLQFADHYFRVIADNRSRQEDSRPRRDDRDQDDDLGYDEDRDDRRPPSRRERGRQDSDQFERGLEGVEAEGDDNPFARDQRESAADERAGRTDRVDRGERPQRPARAERAERSERRPRRRAGAPDADRAGEGDFDATVLPPSLTETLAGEDKPRPRTRRRRANDDEAAAEAVNS